MWGDGCVRGNQGVKKEMERGNIGKQRKDGEGRKDGRLHIEPGKLENWEKGEIWEYWERIYVVFPLKWQAGEDEN